MRKSFPFAVAAALLLTFNPVYATDTPKDDAGKTAIQKQDRAAAKPASPARTEDDQTARVIILGPEGLSAIPNPYENPGPRLISDAWAMRT